MSFQLKLFSTFSKLTLPTAAKSMDYFTKKANQLNDAIKFPAVSLDNLKQKLANATAGLNTFNRIMF